MMITIQAKVVSYCDKHLDNDFISLAIKMLGCLHHHINNFLHQCVNMTWSTKGSKGPLLLIIHSFYRQRVSITL
jgi:hypothetical protein